MCSIFNFRWKSFETFHYYVVDFCIKNLNLCVFVIFITFMVLMKINYQWDRFLVLGQCTKYKYLNSFLYNKCTVNSATVILHFNDIEMTTDNIDWLSGLQGLWCWTSSSTGSKRNKVRTTAAETHPPPKLYKKIL